MRLTVYTDYTMRVLMHLAVKHPSGELATIGLGAARRLPENLLGSGGAQSLDLSVNALAVGRDAGIAENHAGRVPER